MSIFDEDGLDMTLTEYSGKHIFIGTGSKVNFFINGIINDSYLIVVNGDINGDGKIKIAD